MLLDMLIITIKVYVQAYRLDTFSATKSSGNLYSFYPA